MKRFVSISFFSLLFLTVAAQQSYQPVQQSSCMLAPPVGSITTLSSANGLAASSNGWLLPTKGVLRVLVVYLELDYTGSGRPDPVLNGTPGWPVGELPAWKDQLFDAQPSSNPQGTMSKYFYDASLGALSVVGDYLVNPNNPSKPAVVKVPYGEPEGFVDAINAQFGSFKTAHNTSQSEFDLYSDNDDFGAVKTSPSQDNPRIYDHVMFIIRNWDQGNYTGHGNGSSFYHFFGKYDMLNYDVHGCTAMGASDGLPTNVARHEFAHFIFGDNDMHPYGDGVNGCYNMPLPCGWSILSLFNASLMSVNAWDRFRLDWKPAGTVNRIHARNSTNTTEVNGDLDGTSITQAGDYVLRNFLTTGDALRIKLPNIGSATYPQWLWLEFHKCEDKNDIYWLQPGSTCVKPAIPGMYAYNVIAKNETTGTDAYAGRGGYMRILPADGMHDYLFDSNQIPTCVNTGNTPPYRKNLPNALSGEQDQEIPVYDENGDGIISRELYTHAIERIGPGIYESNFASHGHSRHAFTLNGNRKLNICSNPSTATMLNLSVTANKVRITDVQDNRTIYLNGLAIEIIDQTTDYMKIRIRFNDVDVSNDVRWCGDNIALSPVANATNNNSLNLKSGKTIILDQGFTPTRPNVPQVINGKKIFASATTFTALPGSKMNLEPDSRIIVDNKSTLRLQSSVLSLAERAKVVVRNGSTLEIDDNAQVYLTTDAQISIESGAKLRCGKGAEIIFTTNTLLNASKLVEIQGGLEITTDGQFKVTGPGLVRFKNNGNAQVISAGANASFYINNPYGGSMLEVTDENYTLNFPSTIVSMQLWNGRVNLARRAGISIGDVSSTNLSSPYWDNVRLTSLDEITNNEHLGVTLNTQNASFKNCTFERGTYGISLFPGNAPGSLISNYCTFRDLQTGIYAQGDYVNMETCTFNNCTTGFKGSLVNSHAFILNSTFGGSTTTGNNTGLDYQGNGGQGLVIYRSTFGYNTTGVAFTGSFGSLQCSSVQNGDYGIRVNQNGSLFMNYHNFQYTSPGGYNNIGKNQYPVLTDRAQILSIDGGYNNLQPKILNFKALSGTVVGCGNGGTTIQARNNRWSAVAPCVNPALITSGLTDLKAVNSSNTLCSPDPNVTLYDNDPMIAANPVCDQRIITCKNCPKIGNKIINLGCIPPDLLIECATCRPIETQLFVNVKLNVAVAASVKSLQEGNALLSVDMASQILLYSLSNPSSEESELLTTAYRTLLKGIADAFNERMINVADNTPQVHASVQKVLNVQDKLIQKYSNSYHQKLYATLEKAQTYRLAGRRDLALDIVNALLPSVQADELGYAQQWQCKVTAEQQLLNGSYTLRDMQKAVEHCDLVAAKKARIGENSSLPMDGGSSKLNILPNPSSSSAIVTVESETNDMFSLELIDLSGKFVKTIAKDVPGTIEPQQFEVNNADLSEGVYFLRLQRGSNESTVKKYVIVK